MDKDEHLRKFNLAAKIQSMYILSQLSGHYKCILDLCAGDGEITAKLARISDHVYALDLDPMRINRIEALMRKLRLNNVTFNCCSAEKLPYETSMFDVVVCNSALEHILNYKAVIKEIHRVLRPGGMLVLTVPNACLQFGSRFRLYWEFVVKTPMVKKRNLCRNAELARLGDIQSVRDYFRVFFKHEIDFSMEKLVYEFNSMFNIVNSRYLMNFFGALGHDCAYYYRWCESKVFLNICLFMCYLEYKLIKHAKGKGILMACQCIK